MDNRVRVLENENAVGTDPALSQVGFSSTNMMGIFAFPVKVTEVTTASCKFRGGVLKPGFSACDPWVIDTDITTTIHVHVTSSKYLPQIGDHCLAQHVGPYYTGGDWTAKYGLFSAPLESRGGNVYGTDYLYFCMSDPLVASDTYGCATSATAFEMEWNSGLCSGNGGWTCTVNTFSAYETIGKFSKPLTRVGYDGFEGVAKKLVDSDRWEILQMEHLAKWIKFTLRENYEDATVGTGKPKCTISNYWDGHDPEDCFDDTDDFVVWDELALFPRAGAGCVGIAVWDPIESFYKMVTCEQRPQLIKVLAGPFADSDDPVGCTGAAKLNREGDTDPPDLASIANPFGCSADESQMCPATWDAGLTEYVLIGPYNSVDTDTDTHIDVTGSVLTDGCSGSATDVETTNITDLIFNNDWISVSASGKIVTVDIPTEELAVVTNVFLDGTTIKQTKRTATVLCYGSESTTTVATGTVCATV